jgi:hypothetical protein
MNSSGDQRDPTIDAIRAALGRSASVDPAQSVAAVFARIRGRTPAQMVDLHRARVYRALSGVAAAVLAVLWYASESYVSEPRAAAPPVILADGSAVALDDGGFGSYSSEPMVLAGLFLGEIDE